MNRYETVSFLRSNPVFWSRLGFCYDPPLCDENGNIIVFDNNFENYTKTHDAFSLAGVKVHTCILHSGWVGVDKYDYSVCDRVLSSLFASGKTEYFIPRIKLNPPIDWCKENPTELLVYENGPGDIEGIKALIDTEKQDWLGYDSEKGYYNAEGWQDPRPNVGGVISLQSFSSEKWLKDAGEALSRLIEHIESSPYAEKIIAYHIAFGACGESMLWGRQWGRFGDYGISNQKHFLDWSVKKYGGKEQLYKAWGEEAEKEIIPPSHLRENAEKLYKDDISDCHSIDYDLYMGEVTTNAIMHFADIVHKKTNKAFGTFYGYILHMTRTAYTGHLAFKRLLDSGKVDFFAAPKSYSRSAPGEPGGEMAPAVSVNRVSLWLDECDNRTHLSSDTIGGVAQNLDETCAVQLREFCKNISHGSGLWYMDLGGNWYDDDGIMENIKNIVSANETIKNVKHRSVAEITVIVDEYSVLKTHPERTVKTENFLRELQLCGAPVDVIFSHDIGNIDLSKTKLAVLITPRYLTDAESINLRKEISENGKLLTVGETKVKGDFNVSEETDYKALRKLVESAEVDCLAPENCAVYADNRIVSFFPRETVSFIPQIADELYDIYTGKPLDKTLPLTIKGRLGRAFVRR